LPNIGRTPPEKKNKKLKKQKNKKNKKKRMIKAESK
jgi:hypothetical protein